MKRVARADNDHFDREYYERYYRCAETAVLTPEMQRNEVAFVISFCRHIEMPIERFCDVGAGTGWWARELERQYPSCGVIETFDASRAACEVYGHRNVDVRNLKGPSADLVVCRDVLRYVPESGISRAITRLAAKCRGVLYLHVITSDDDIDEEASDMKGWFRTVAWYRRALKAAGFRDCGMGLFVSDKLETFDPFAIDSR
ncbi:MAG TPA: methyltransferase domain-containing protein [Gemmatimonadaceae bacterium]|nr:methyltransferase domain-containing protein [Gemmatimonadaceae bacterium]